MKTKMGSWKLTAHSPAIVASSGVVAVQGKDDDALADFSLKYSWLKQQIEDNPLLSEYQMQKYSPVTIMKVVAQNKPIETLGDLEIITKVVDVTYELKRCYKELPQRGKDLMKRKFKSIPWDYSVVMDKTGE